MSSEDSNDDGASASNDEDNPSGDSWLRLDDLPADHPIAAAHADPNVDNAEPLNLAFEFHPSEPHYRMIDTGSDMPTQAEDPHHLPSQTEEELAALMRKARSKNVNTRA